MQTFLFSAISNLSLSRKIILLGFVLCTSILGQAQMMDSIKLNLQQHAKFAFKLDTRNSFITSTRAKVKGVKIGVSHGRSFGYGIGYNWMSNDFYINSDSTNLRMNYVSGYVDYTFYKSKRWTLQLPVQIGFGKMFYRNNQKDIIEEQWAPIWEPAMTMEFKFLKYFGVGFGAGYRLVFKSSQHIKEQFTAPVYIFKFKIYFDKIYSDVIHNDND
ncbi:MAG: hypothetical protein ACI9N1_001802 [Flavobacteriales bacterium]